MLVPVLAVLGAMEISVLGYLDNLLLLDQSRNYLRAHVQQIVKSCRTSAGSSISLSKLWSHHTTWNNRITRPHPGHDSGMELSSPSSRTLDSLVQGTGKFSSLKPPSHPPSLLFEAELYYRFYSRLLQFNILTAWDERPLDRPMSLSTKIRPSSGLEEIFSPQSVKSTDDRHHAWEESWTPYQSVGPGHQRNPRCRSMCWSSR